MLDQSIRERSGIGYLLDAQESRQKTQSINELKVLQQECLQADNKEVREIGMKLFPIIDGLTKN